MAEKQLFTATDLGGGDGGKGGVVHKICVTKGAHMVIKIGGAQGSHGVRTSRGESFNFSQLGCGTLDGIPTHLSSLFVVDPNGVINEGELLKYNFGLRNIFDYLTVDEEALCITPWHQLASRLHELARKDKPRGTIGTGVGEAFLDAELFPDLIIRAKDLSSPRLREKLDAVRNQKLLALADLTNIEKFLASDYECAQNQIDLLEDPGLIDWTYDRFKSMASLVKIVDRDYLRREILSRDGVVVVESSHGVLTDKYHGFHPHTSKLRTIPNGTWNLLKELDYDGDVIKLGITRAYQIRHGAGPMVTESPDLVEKLLPGSNKDENRWQGKVRVGPLDFVALRYAVNVCGGPGALDGIAVTWFDQILEFGAWPICNQYSGASNLKFFTPSGDIKIMRGNDEAQLKRQEELGNLLRKCKPVVTSYDIPNNRLDLIALCENVFQEKLSLAVRMISLGATENDKICI